MCDLHSFFIAIATAVVDEDGRGKGEGGKRGRGTAPSLMVWCARDVPKRCRVVEAVRGIACLLGLAVWAWSWQGWLSVTTDDVRRWLFSVGALVKLVTLLSSLQGGPVRDSFLRNLFLGIVGLGDQFRCQPLLRALAPMFGSCISTLEV